jgi:hypothetical protein
MNSFLKNVLVIHFLNVEADTTRLLGMSRWTKYKPPI